MSDVSFLSQTVTGFGKHEKYVGYIQLRSKLKLFTKKSSSRVVLLVDAFRSSDYFFPEINRWKKTEYLDNTFSLSWNRSSVSASICRATFSQAATKYKLAFHKDAFSYQIEVLYWPNFIWERTKLVNDHQNVRCNCCLLPKLYNYIYCTKFVNGKNKESQTWPNKNRLLHGYTTITGKHLINYIKLRGRQMTNPTSIDFNLHLGINWITYDRQIVVLWSFR